MFNGSMAFETRFMTKSITESFLGHFDRDLRAIAPGEPGFVLQARGHGTVAGFMCIAEFVEIEQFGRQRLAPRMTLTFVLVDAYLQLSGHCKRLPLSRALLARTWLLRTLKAPALLAKP
jgi:hypothetical protein